jgi:hypothetical protein
MALLLHLIQKYKLSILFIQALLWAYTTFNESYQTSKKYDSGTQKMEAWATLASKTIEINTSALFILSFHMVFMDVLTLTTEVCMKLHCCERWIK